MAAILASQSCYCRDSVFTNNGEKSENLSFSRSISVLNFSKSRKLICILPGNYESARFSVKMSRTDQLSTRYSTNVNENSRPSSSKAENVNGAASIVSKEKSMVKSPPSMLTTRNEEIRVMRSAEDFSWANENYNSWQRSIDIWSTVLSLRMRVVFDNAKWAYLGGFSEHEQKRRRKKTASWLRERLIQLGPTFIKLGQLSSTRSDLFPPEFLEELAMLQDKVPAFSATKARRLIESELGAPVDELFREFEDQPIAAASLGQVYRAVTHDGVIVVVKVQRPGLKKLFDIDMRNLKLVSEYFQRSETFGGPNQDWIGIYEECSKVLYQEIDYINEGRNAERFRRDFRNIKWVRVPTVFWDYTAKKVLTLEYVPGIKINQLNKLDSKGFNRSRIASRSIEAYLIQILKTGFFHADPHPGNLAIDKDESIIYYDFGMMGEIKPFTRERLLELFYAIYEQDEKKVMNILVELDVLQPTGDMVSVRRSVKFYLDNLLGKIPDRQQTLTAIGEDLFAIALDQPFRFPSTFAFVIRAFSTLEGIGRVLKPDFSFAKVAAPYAQELLDLRHPKNSASQLVEGIMKHVDDVREHTMSMPYRVHRIEEFVKELDSGDLKLRVRVLESERVGRKATMLQMATMYTIMSGILLNLGITLYYQGYKIVANGSFTCAGDIFLF
ncbi:hypothetical protein ACFE04_031051 [Oxalis oulophora]